MYVELHTHSAYSFGDGVCTPEALAARAAELGYEALALTDARSWAGVVRFAMEAQGRGVQPIGRGAVGGRPCRWCCWCATRRVP
jgi:error-prone DNA polymerase